MVERGIIELMVTDDIFVKLNNDDGICIGKCMYPTSIRYHMATFTLYGCTLD